jgi:hypothetical protein
MDQTLQYVSLYESYLGGGLSTLTKQSVALGSEATFNVMAMAARDGKFLNEYLAFMYKISQYVKANPAPEFPLLADELEEDDDE